MLGRVLCMQVDRDADEEPAANLIDLTDGAGAGGDDDLPSARKRRR